MTTTFRMQPSGIPAIPKSPDENLDYTEDWSAWLASGETINAGPTVTVDTGLTKGAVALVNSATGVTVWLSGGTVGTTYMVTIAITTTAGRTGERSFQVGVIAR